MGNALGPKLGLRSRAEDLDQAIRDHLVLAIFELPDSKTEAVGITIAGMAMMLAAIVRGRRVRIASAHAAGTGSHTSDSDWPAIGQLLHDLPPGDLELGGIDLPAVTRCHVAESLRVELPRESRYSKRLHRIGNNLRSLVVHFQRGVEVLIDEDLQRLQHAEDGFFANLAATADAIFLRAHIEQGVVDQLFLADKDAGCLWSADILAAAEGDHVEAECRILPEPLFRRHVGCGIGESVEVVCPGDFDGLRPADLALVGQNIGEVDRHRLRIDGGNYLFARLDFDQLRARLPDLMVERIAMALLDDDFVSGEIAYVGNVAHARLKVFGHHAGVADHHGRGRAAGHQTGVAGGRLTQFRDELAGGDLEFVEQNEVLVASSDELHDLRPHHRSTDNGYGAVNIDERCDSQLGVDVASGTQASGDWYDGSAVDRWSGALGLLKKETRSAQLCRSEEAAGSGPKCGEK